MRIGAVLVILAFGCSNTKPTESTKPNKPTRVFVQEIRSEVLPTQVFTIDNLPADADYVDVTKTPVTRSLAPEVGIDDLSYHWKVESNEFGIGRLGFKCPEPGFPNHLTVSLPKWTVRVWCE